MTYLLLVIGFALLIKGADYFVDGASAIARSLNVSAMMIGLTIVALGTSAPEATVSILAAVNGSTDVALGNIVGSNILNITFIVGVTALVSPLVVKSSTIRKEIPFTMLGSLLLFLLISDKALNQSSENVLSRGDGLVLLVIFGVFMYYIFEIARNERNRPVNETAPQPDESEVNVNKPLAVLKLVGGLAGVIYGGHLVVTNAVEIAYSFGMSETLVGLTIVAIGTSLPELVTSITAALKKQSEIAIGNLVGSNIFNILFVLGATATISPIPVGDTIFTDIFILIGVTIALFIFSRTKFRISRLEGTILVAAYIIYLVFIIVRG